MDAMDKKLFSKGSIKEDLKSSLTTKKGYVKTNLLFFLLLFSSNLNIASST